MERILENKVELADIDPARTAVLGIHWQIDAVKPEGAFGSSFAKTAAESAIIERTGRLFSAAREAGAHIIYINVVFWPGYRGLVRNNSLFESVVAGSGFVRGTRGVEVIPELTPQDGDFVFEHSRISAFYGTDIESVLRAEKIETLIMTGVATNVAVDHSVRDAAQLGFQVIVLEDCCGTSDRAHHDAALMTLRVLATKVTTSDVLIPLLKK